MGRASVVVLSIFSLTLASLFLGWVTFALANKARAAYRLWKNGG